MQRKRMGMRMVQRTTQVQGLRQRRIVAITSVALLLIFGTVFLINIFKQEEAFAANAVVWTNGNGNNNWSDPLNWNTGAVPGTNDIATFSTSSANCSINANVSVSGISIASGYSGIVTQPAGKTITLASSGFNQAGGTFVGGTSTIDINSGTFTLSGGAFTSTSGGLYIGGNFSANTTLFTHSGGTFNANNASVVFDPAMTAWSGAPTFTVDVINSTSFYNVTVNASTCCNAAIFATAAGDTIDVTNDLTHADGFISGTLEVKNNLTINANTDGGTGTIVMNGTGAQTYSTVGTHRTCQIYIDKSSGTFTPAAATNLYMQKLTVANGSFTAPTGTMAIGGNFSVNQTLLTHSGGTFNANGGTVLFDPAMTSWIGSPTFTIDVLNSTSFYNVNLKASSCCNTAIIATAAGDTIESTNDLSHQDGFLSGLFEVKGNLSVSAGTDGGSGSIIVDGTGAQTFSATGIHRTCQIYIDKPSGAFTPVGATDLYTQALTLANGSFTAPSGILAVGGSLSVNQNLFTQTGGTYNANNGTLLIDPTVNSWIGSPTYTLDVLSTTSLYNIELKGASCCNTAIITTASGDTVKATNNLTHSDGYISGLFDIKNDLNVAANTDGGDGTIFITGTGTETYNTTGTHRTCQVYINKASGTFVPGGSTTDLYTQRFTLANGSFTAPTGNLAAGGRWGVSQTLFTHSGGTYNAGNGTLLIDPTVNSWVGSPTFTIDVLSSTSLYNLNLKAVTCCNTATITTASGDTVKSTNDFTHSDGYISGIFEFKNNLIVAANTDGGNGILIADGTGAQTFTTTGTHRSAHLYINKSAGTFTAAPGTTALYVQQFTLANGSFTAPTGTLAIGGGWATNATLLTHSGGTFNPNNGTVLIDPAVNSWVGSPTFTLDVLNNTSLYNLTLNASTCCNLATIATAAGDTVEAVNDLTHSDGFMTGLFEVKNNLIVNANTDGGSGTIIVDGSGAQTYATSGTHRTCMVLENKSAGSFAAAGGTTSFYIAGFSLVNGSFTAPTGIFNIGGPWATNATLFTQSGGTYNHNNGTLCINPTVSSWVGSPTFTLDVLPSTSFYNVNINAATCCNTATFTTAANDTIDVTGSLLYTDGRSTATVEASGDVTVMSTHDSGSGKLIFKGSSNQTFDLSGATALFDGDIVVNKTSGKVTLASACILNVATQRMTFTKGIVVSTAANLLTFGDNFTVSGASDSSFVQGPVSKIGNDIFTFPIGANDTIYASLRISAPSTTASQYTAEYIHNDPNSSYNRSSKDAALNKVSSCEYWTLNRDAGVSPISVTLSWNSPRSCGVYVPADLRVARWDGTAWRDQGNGGAAVTGNSGTLPSSGTMSNFGPYSLGSSTANNALPIELVSFTAIYNNGNVDLKWITASEKDNDYFTIEKSRTLDDITEVKRVDGAGTSVIAITYADFDDDPFDGLSYYRLKQTDFDGKFAYSDWVKVLVNKVNGIPMVKIFPNPCDGNNINLEITDLENVSLNIRVSDLSGKNIFSNTITVESSNEIRPLGQPQQLLPGTYVVSIIGDDNKFSYKLVVK
ncbi:MAG: T9SS type A sorting domain-containing protein [Bacteroidota bacterium]